jgi:hypothetical protein
MASAAMILAAVFRSEPDAHAELNFSGETGKLESIGAAGLHRKLTTAMTTA